MIISGVGVIVGLLVFAPAQSSSTAVAPHVRVEYRGLSSSQAQAIADTLSAAWTVYRDEFGFDMPGTVHVDAAIDRQASSRLYTDGNDRVYLTLPDASKLNRPEVSGVYHVYGLCHELGHVAMYRVLKKRDWMTTAAAEGWAHFAGSAVVDRVYALKGEKLWCDPYDYRKDGTARLDAQLASGDADDVTRGAELWRDAESVVGMKGFPALFAAWNTARVDLADPAPDLSASGARAFPGNAAGFEAWWTNAARLFVERRPASDVAARTADPASLTGRPLTVAGDDGKADGKKSIAGGGHARRFTAPGGGSWYLRNVLLFGSRYGSPQAPDETFEVSLCDEQMRPIATWEKPYSTFDRGDARWVKIEVTPTAVPPAFHVCFNFRPTGTRGVYVSFDASTRGNSQTAVPGKPGSPLDAGDWMIRVELDQPRSADALGGR
ncbi:MAG: hypothetical protein FLDDKLPJ_01635 [Phycisphaerae bacterium]|nr:hypothetical protein [Phycisphaerae bacterium]